MSVKDLPLNLSGTSNSSWDCSTCSSTGEVSSMLEKDLASGKAHSFTGPIYDQKGNILVAEGAVADDGMLAGMNVYVKGVEGDIPQ